VSDPAQQAAVANLQTWLSAGAKRRETAAGSKTYANADAVRTMDAWWPLLAKAEFGPALGDDLYNALAAAAPVDESPGASHSSVTHQGSSFQSGWWSYVDKDIRAVLGQPVAGGLVDKYCGGGSVAQCRTVLLTTLAQAAATPATTVYPGDGNCSGGDQWCADSIIQSPLGGITDAATNWQNRPTFQQVVQYPAHR
jgi:hypothetical protein